VENALGLEQAERSAELPADDQANENGSGRGRRTGKKNAKDKADKNPEKAPRQKHTFTVENELFKRLRLTAIDRDCEMSDLLNNALRAYLPKAIRLVKGDDAGTADAAAGAA
jgi:predicted transcriptional regulator